MASASDNFNRANESPIAAPWTKQTGNNFNLVSNQIQGTGASDSFYYYAGAATSADQYSQALYSTAISSNDWGPAVRVGGAGNNGVAEGYFLDPYTGGTNGIQKHVNGSFGLVTGGSVPFAGVVGDTYRIEAQGTTLRAYRNGVLATTATDTSLTLTGNGPGLFIYEGGSGGIDDWAGGDLGGAVVIPDVVMAPMIVC